MKWIREKVALSGLTSWQVGGEAEFYAEPATKQELVDVMAWAENKGLIQQITILGGGSNVLISDDGIPGLTLGMRKLAGILKAEVTKEANQLEVHCLGGTPKAELLKIFLKEGLAPALFLAGLPGDVGGGIVMNAGVAEPVAPREFCELVKSFEVYDYKNTKFRTVQGSEVTWDYRHSSGWQPGIITEVHLVCPMHDEFAGNKSEILDRVRKMNHFRLSKQPLDMPSCGSVFRNPEGYKAAQLIDQAGLKGYRIGDAQVSLKHANFIVNLGSAKARELHDLIGYVKAKVFEASGVHLQTEVVYLGRW